jgi:hypothetical protein
VATKLRGFFSAKRVRTTIAVIAAVGVVTTSSYYALYRYASADSVISSNTLKLAENDLLLGVLKSKVSGNVANEVTGLGKALSASKTATTATTTATPVSTNKTATVATSTKAATTTPVSTNKTATATTATATPIASNTTATSDENIAAGIVQSNDFVLYSLANQVVLTKTDTTKTKTDLEKVLEYIDKNHATIGSTGLVDSGLNLEGFSTADYETITKAYYIAAYNDELPDAKSIADAYSFKQNMSATQITALSNLYNNYIIMGKLPPASDLNAVADIILASLPSGYTRADAINLLLNPDIAVQELSKAVPATTTTAEITAAKAKLEAIMPGIFNSPGLYFDAQSGRTMFKTLVYNDLSVDQTGTANKELIGYVLFDPYTKSYNAQISKDYNGKDITLYSDAANGIAYMEYGNSDGTPLFGKGGVKLMSFKVSSDGIGGSFELMGRLFSFNPSTKALEYTIPVDFGNKSKSTDGTGILGSITVDSKGGVRGRVDLTIKGNSQGSIFFDRNGNFAYGRAIYSGGTQIGSISFGSGGLSGSIGLEKFIGANAFIDFGSGGIKGFGGNLSVSGTNIPIAFSLKSGTTIGVPGLMGLVNFGLDKAGLSINIPIIGSIHLLGGDDRPDCSEKASSRASLVGTSLMTNDADGNPQLTFNTIYSCRKINGGLRGSYTSWQNYTLTEADEKYRSAQIFAAYNSALKRNPTEKEYMNWYFFFQNSKKYKPSLDSTEKTSADIKSITAKLLEESVKRVVDSDGNITDWGKNSDEANWIDAGKDASTAPGRPTSSAILSADPFTSAAESDADRGSTLEELFDKITAMAGSDPDWTEILAEIEKCKETKCSFDTYEDGTQVGTVSVASGYSTYVVPASVGAVDASKFVNKGVEIFQYDTAAKAWKSTALGNDIAYMAQGIGYYLYNGTGATVTVPLIKTTLVDTASIKNDLSQGWNLKGNSETTAKLFSEINLYVAGTQSTISSLGTAGSIYNYIFIIKDGSATTATDAFTTVPVTSTDTSVDSVHAYWIYLK